MLNSPHQTDLASNQGEHAPTVDFLRPSESENDQLQPLPTDSHHSSSTLDPYNCANLDGGDFFPGTDSWFLAEDFDLGALDAALNATLQEWAQPSTWQSIPKTPDASRRSVHRQAPDYPEPQNPAVLAEQHDMQVGNEIGRGSQPTNNEQAFPWHSRLRAHDDDHGPMGTLRDTPSRVSGRVASERPVENIRVDEQYRDSLSTKLLPRQYEQTHLSVDHLNLCLRLYLRRFHPICPVVHIPSFRPNSRNTLLFLSMCSIGSLFIGSTEAVNQGYEIFQRLHKTILASWESHLSASKSEALSAVQAALLGQIFGSLSVRPSDLFMTDAFHGTLIAWARSVGAFDDNVEEFLAEDMPIHDVNKAWKEWIHREQARRIALALYIQDSNMATLHHHDPLLRHFTISYGKATSDSLFEAPTAEKWYALTKELHRASSSLAPITVTQWMTLAEENDQNIMALQLRVSGFTAYSILANLNACIIESRAIVETEPIKSNFTSALIRWYSIYPPEIDPDAIDPFHSGILWHFSFMFLFVNPVTLDQALGRDGASASEKAVANLRQWSTSSSYLRCLFHACMLLERVESIGLSATPAIHVPQALYQACIALICHSLFLRPHFQLHPQWGKEVKEFPEVQALLRWNKSHVMRGMAAFPERLGQDQFDMAYGFADLLKKLNRWGIAESFAGTITEVVQRNNSI